MINFEKYLIPAMEPDTEIPSTIKVSLFGKTWNCKVLVTGDLRNNLDTANKILKLFILKSNKISKNMEDIFVEYATNYMNEYSDNKVEYTKYSDIPNLTLTGVYLGISKSHNNRWAIKLFGNYDVDIEHGWAIDIIFNNTIGSIFTIGELTGFIDYIL